MAGGSLALLNARVLDGVNDSARAGDGRCHRRRADRVGWAHGGRDRPAVGRRHRRRGRTVMPGLVDAHLHISSLALPQPELRVRNLPASCAPSADARGAELLEGGVTTVRMRASTEPRCIRCGTRSSWASCAGHGSCCRLRSSPRRHPAPATSRACTARPRSRRDADRRPRAGQGWRRFHQDDGHRGAHRSGRGR